ncbi:unnamed protein product [Boreogadus saida]
MANLLRLTRSGRLIGNVPEQGTVWTSVKNNLSPQTAVSALDQEGKAVLRLDYNMSTEQVYAVTSGADYCEQHIAYTCRMSRLLNSPDGEPYTWWVGRANEKHLYWGGSGPGIQKCACGIERNCTSAKHQCNCDADQRQWREDAGLLVYKDHLPVSQLVVGDTGRAGSEAKLTVGPLRCRGDRDFWNAASFTSPASYLHFPSLKGETSADISFYFKTSSTYGVFLENLGTTDFIRIELKATSVISFSFDVGNGGVELAVRSPSRLDDGRWHRVEAERNLKEAVLSLDGRYRDARPAPAQGHIRLELFSQLYIGKPRPLELFSQLYIGKPRPLELFSQLYIGKPRPLELFSQLYIGKPRPLELFSQLYIGKPRPLELFSQLYIGKPRPLELFSQLYIGRPRPLELFSQLYIGKPRPLELFSQLYIGKAPPPGAVQPAVHRQLYIGKPRPLELFSQLYIGRPRPLELFSQLYIGKPRPLELFSQLYIGRPRPLELFSQLYIGRPRPLELFSQLYIGKPRPLELFSQLYIGASGGQRGFLGCMRALRLNGVTLDLEERARVTPGVKPGCQGHCNHFGVHCRNGGVCVEQYNGYSCDCSHTAYDGRFCTNDVGGYFESGTLVRYDFPSGAGLPASGAPPRGPQGAALLGETNLTREELVFSFSTSNAPAILVYVSSKTQDYLAVVLRNNGTLQIRYSLGGLTEPYTIDLDHRNMANGQPHHVNVSREQRSVHLQLDHYPVSTYTLPDASDTHFNLVKTMFLGKVFETGEIDPVLIDRYNTPGFVGCLSRVTLNGVAPLKAALRPGPAAAPVTAHGILVPSNCGAQPLTISPLGAAHDPWQMDTAGAVFPYNNEMISRERLDHNSAVIGGIVAVVICLALGVLVFLVRHMFRHKGSYHTNEAKGAESADCADAAIIVNDPAFTETIEESKKEWFI